MIPALVMLGVGFPLLLLGVASERYYRTAKRHRAEAKADRDAAARIHAATAEHVREAVTRKPFDVAERPPAPLFALLVDEGGRMVPLALPRGTYSVFGRVPRGLA